MCFQPHSWACSFGESDSTFTLFPRCPWPPPRRGPLSAWHRPLFPPQQEQLVSSQDHVKCSHICSCVWDGQAGAGMAHTDQVMVKVPHLIQGRDNTGAWSLQVLFRGSHISPLIPTVKVSPQLATVFKAEGRFGIQGQTYYSHFTD